MVELAEVPAATSAAPATTSRRGGAGGNIVAPVATSAAQGGGDVGDARGQTKRENDFRTMESAITYDTIICPCVKCSTLSNRYPTGILR